MQPEMTCSGDPAAPQRFRPLVIKPKQAKGILYPSGSTAAQKDQRERRLIPIAWLMEAPMIDWWSETDHAILDCLLAAGPMSPEDLSHRIGLSPGETSAFVAMLVREGRVRIRLVDLAEDEALNHPGGDAYEDD